MLLTQTVLTEFTIPIALKSILRIIIESGQIFMLGYNACIVDNLIHLNKM